MNRVEIFYFSETGNSLHVAQEIQKRIPDTTLIPILCLLKEKVVEPMGDIIGLVFPIYLQSTPIPVREFIRKINFKPNQFLFAVTTNCGYPGKVEYYLEKLLAKRGRGLDFYHTLKMASNKIKIVQSKPKWQDELRCYYCYACFNFCPQQSILVKN